MSSSAQLSQQQANVLRQLSPQQQAAIRSMATEQRNAVLQQVLQKEQQAVKPKTEWCRVFKPEIDSVANDPLDPVKRYHDGVFVELDSANGKGTFFHVTGDIIANGGMRYEEKRGYQPGASGRLYRNTHIGWVLKRQHDSGSIGAVLRALPKPTKQQGINFWEKDPRTGRHEIIWTKENGDRYGPNEQRRPVFKCNEWTAGYAIPTLRSRGILCNAPAS